MESNTGGTATVPTRLLRRLSVHNGLATDLLQPESASTPQLSMRRMSPGSSPSKRQLKNYDMKELENRNGGLGWVGPIYGNKAHSSRRYVSPTHDDSAEAIKRKSNAHSGRRGSAAMLQEMYPAGAPAPTRGTTRRPPQRRGNSGSPDQHHHHKSTRASQKTGQGGGERRSGKRAPRDGGVGSGGRAGAESLIMEQKKLLRLLQESIRAEDSVTNTGGKKHGALNRGYVQPKKERRSLAGESHTYDRRDAPLSRHGLEYDDSNHGNKRYSFPGSEPSRRPLYSQRDTDSSDTSSSDSAVDSDSSSSSSDHLGNDDESMSSLDSRGSYGHDAFMSHHNSRQDVERAHNRHSQHHRGRDRQSKHSTNRVHHVDKDSGRKRSHRSSKGRGYTTTAQVRYTSPNTSSTVAAARAGISHNFFELYGGRPGGVRVPEKVKISSMVEKATPIRNSADQSSTRRRLASPTVSSGRRFHTPELDRVHNRRSVSADSYRESASGLTDAAEWSRLTDWLGRLKLQKYAGLFRRSGITKLSLVELLRGHDLAEIGIDLNDHPRILQSIQDFSHRTISFAEEALSPHEERLPRSNPRVERKTTNDRSKSIETRRYGQDRSAESTPEHNDYITSKDVLTGDRRTGAAYRPLSLEDLLKLGSPERRATESLSQSEQLSSRIQNRAQERLSQSQDTKTQPPSSSQVRLARSGGDIPQVPTKTGIGTMLSSTPISASKSALPKVQSPNPVLESTLLSLNKAFWVGDETLFYKIWDTVVGDLHSRNESTTAVIQASHLLELFSRVYFVTWPQRPQFRGHEGGLSNARARFRTYIDKILAEPDKYSGLLKSREFATFVGIGMLPDAASNAAYSSLFKPEWADGLAKRLNSFLSNVMSTAVPSTSPAERGGDDRAVGSSDVILGGEDVGPPVRRVLQSGVVLGSPCGAASDSESDQESMESDEGVDSVVPHESSDNVLVEISGVDDKTTTTEPQQENGGKETAGTTEPQLIDELNRDGDLQNNSIMGTEQDGSIKSNVANEEIEHSTSNESSSNKDLIVEESRGLDVLVADCVGKIDDSCIDRVGVVENGAEILHDSEAAKGELSSEVEVLPPESSSGAMAVDVAKPSLDQGDCTSKEEIILPTSTNESVEVEVSTKIITEITREHDDSGDEEGVNGGYLTADENGDERDGDNGIGPENIAEGVEEKSLNDKFEVVPDIGKDITDLDTFESDVIATNNVVTNGGGGKKKKRRKSKAR